MDHLSPFRRKSPSCSIGDFDSSQTRSMPTYVGVFVSFNIQQVRPLSQSDPWLEPLYEKECRIKISFPSQASGTLTLPE